MQSSVTKMTVARRIAAIVLILVAGVVAYLAYAEGDGGPLTSFGHRDADIQAVNAWHQIPIHIGLAIGLATAGISALRVIAGTATAVGLIVMVAWAALLTISDVGALGDYTDAADLTISATLLALYAAVVALAWLAAGE